MLPLNVEQHICAESLVGRKVSHIGCGSAGNKGYTFATWLRLERMVFDPTTAGQSIFCFLSRIQGTAKGMAAALQGLLLTFWLIVQAALERQCTLFPEASFRASAVCHTIMADLVE